MLSNKRGISLIVLAITIVIITILAVAVILSFNSNNPIDNAYEATLFLVLTYDKNADIY